VIRAANQLSTLPLGRRTLLRRGVYALGLGVFSRACPVFASASPILRLYTWAGYFKPELVSSFAEDHGCQVEISTFGSNEEMLVNLEAEKGRYDLVTPSTYAVGPLRRSGLLSNIDPSIVPNLGFVEESHAGGAGKSAMEWSVPFAVSVSGVGYAEGKHQPCFFSWSAFEEPGCVQKYTLLDDMREVLGAALKASGKSVNSTSASDIETAKAVANRWIKGARKFQSEGYRGNLVSGVDKLAHGYGGDFLQQADPSAVTQFFIPEEGTPMTCDHFCVPAHSKSKRLAHEFINFFCLPHIAAKNMEWSGFRSTIGGVRGLLPLELREHPTLYPTAELLQRCEPLEDLGDALSMYEKAWSSLILG
jgi:spermidine/putrescine transport system substrate-binding protein